MNYVPLFGRWATLLLAVAIAVGATALSLGLDQKMKREGATSSDMTEQVAAIDNPWAANEAAPAERSASDQIVIVNPDGSVRNETSSLLPDDGRMKDSMDDYVPRETNRDWAIPDTGGENRPFGRIE
ncbi:MAG: hypothetical protein AB7G24_02060 [Novosphingobium sp.]